MKRYIYHCFTILVGGSVLLGGCAAVEPAVPIQAGEKAYIAYSCYNTDALAVTTDLEAVDRAGKKTNYFIPPKEPGPALITTGSTTLQQINSMPIPVDFERAVEGYLAQAMVGHPFDRSVTLEISGKPNENIIKRERYVKMNRYMALPLRFASPLEGAKAYWGEEIKPGDTFPHKENPLLSYVIEDIKDDEVHIKTLFEEGVSNDHLFGKIHYEAKDEETINQVFDPYVGLIVRSGRLLGQVVEVRERSFTIDYGDPLAGQTLACTVTAKPDTDPAPAKKTAAAGDNPAASGKSVRRE